MPRIISLISHPQRPVVDTEFATRVMIAAGGRALDVLDEGIAVEFAVDHDEALDERLRALIGEMPVDLVIQDHAGRRKAMLLADMDSTMIDQECIDELADMAGFGEKVAAITARAMNGEIAFEPALRERVALLAGLPEAVIAQVIRDRITLASGGQTLIATMKAQGAFTALVSGGFTAFTGPVAAKLGFDVHRANILHAADGKLVGTVADPILGKQAKVDALEDFCAQRAITANDVIAVGDGANDLGMLERAGTGVALHAKPSVAAAAPHRIDHGDLTALLYLQGYRRSDFAE